MRAIRRMVGAMAAALLASALSGCIVVPPRHYHGGGGYGYRDGYGPAVAGPPAVGYVWIDGCWEWREGRRTWVDGHWGPPRR